MKRGAQLINDCHDSFPMLLESEKGTKLHMVENLFNTPVFPLFVLEDFSLCVWFLGGENSKIY